MKPYHVEAYSGSQAKFYHVLSCYTLDEARNLAKSMSADWHTIVQVCAYNMTAGREITLATFQDGQLRGGEK